MTTPLPARSTPHRPAVVFRCNVSATVGIGHLMRCREMARDLGARGYDCVLLGPPQSLQHAQDADLFVHWQEVPERGSSAQDAARVIALCQHFGARHLVMDDYRGDPDYQVLLKAAGLRWLQQFDASAPWDFHGPLVVNSSPYERHAHYVRWLRDPAARTLFGPRYAVLRPAFARVQARADGRAVRRVFVGFGGGDDRGAIDTVLDALAGQMPGVPLPDITLVVVSGSGNPRAQALAARIAALSNVEFHVDPPDMPGLMAGCDLAVIGGGTMSYEAAICGLPMIFVALAPNQQRPCQGWHDLTAAVVLGQVGQVAARDVRAAVQSLSDDAPRRQEMAAAGRALVDGQGAARLVDALLEKDEP